MIKMITISLRIDIIGDKKILDLRGKNQRLMFAIWHGRHFLIISRLRFPDTSVLTSTSRDGKLIADILKKFGFDIIPGSSHRSPVRALLTSIQKMRGGKNLIFAVDGPTGPIHQSKPGALFVAKKADAFIVPVSFSSKPAVIFNSWDRFMLPLPFAKTCLLFGEPFKPSDDLSQETIHMESLELQNMLNALTLEADRQVGYEQKADGVES